MAEIFSNYEVTFTPAGGAKVAGPISFTPAEKRPDQIAEQLAIGTAYRTRDGRRFVRVMDGIVDLSTGRVTMRDEFAGHVINHPVFEVLGTFAPA